MQFEYEVRGTNRVRNQLRTAAKFHPDKTDPIIGRHVKGERGRLKSKPYPARRPGQTYIRTGNLANRWYSRRKRQGVHELGNSALYAVWVIKKGWQTRNVHEGRWWTAEDQLALGMPRLTVELSVELEDLLEDGIGPF